MTPGTRYPNAPITEAVIDIQVAASASMDRLAEAFADEPAYSPEKLFATTAAMTFSPDANTVATATSEPIGYLYRSTDKLHICQARTNGFTFGSSAESVGEFKSFRGC